MLAPGEHSAGRRVIFVETPPGNVIHYNVLNDAVQFDLRVFCNSMVQGARDWIAQPGHTADWTARYEALIKRHPQGLAPYVSGMPVIG